MNEFSRRTAAENDIPAMKNLIGKDVAMAPAMRSKSRAFEDVENVRKPFGPVNGSRLAAVERQRENAEKLSRGFSVVHSKAGGDQENAKEVTKVRAPLRMVAKENGAIAGFSRVTQAPVPIIGVNRVTQGPAQSSFRAPGKPVRVKKPPPYGLQKAPSVTSLQNHVQESEPKNLGTSKSETALVSNISSLIIDDDKKFEKDEFLLGIYAKDIYKFLKRLETQQSVKSGYLTRQHLMTENMRAVLVDWMFEVQQSFDLLQDTTQMAVSLLDRFLQDAPKVPKEDLQLVGVTCIFLASKYEEMYPPAVTELVLVSADACSKAQILRMEQRIFRCLDFSIGRPPPVQFLRRYCRVAQVSPVTYTFSKYFVDLALVQYKFCHLPPSLLAAVALYLALFIHPDSSKEESLWTPTLMYFTEYSTADLKPFVPKLAKLVIQAPTLKQQSVQQMYAHPKKQSGVSTRPELKSEKLLALANSESSENSLDVQKGR